MALSQSPQIASKPGPCRTVQGSIVTVLTGTTAAITATNAYGNAANPPADATGTFVLPVREPTFDYALSAAIAGGATSDTATLRLWDVIPVAGVTTPEYTFEYLGEVVFSVTANAPNSTATTRFVAGKWCDAATITNLLTSSRAPAVKRGELAAGAKVVVEIPVRGVGLVVAYTMSAVKNVYLESRPTTVNN